MDVFFIKDGELLGKFNGIWNKVKNNIKKEINCEPVNKKIFEKKNKV